MKIILLKDVPKLGHKFQIKEVRPGYGQNFLIKNGFAVLATDENERRMGAEMHAYEEGHRMREALLLKSVEDINNTNIRFVRKVNEKGHLFDKIDVYDIKKALHEQLNIELDEKHIHLKSPIRETGEWDVGISIGGKEATIKIIIEPEK